MKIKSHFLLLVFLTLIQTYQLQAIFSVPTQFLTNPIIFALQKLLTKSSETSLLLSNSNNHSNSTQTPTSSKSESLISADVQQHDLYTKEDWDHIDYLIKKKRFKEITQYYEGQNQEGVNKKNNDGLTGLHLAVINGNVEAVKHFLEIKADPNKQDKDGNTPLHKASELNNPEIMHALMDGGANRNIKNKAEKTFIEIQLDHQNNKKSFITKDKLAGFFYGIAACLGSGVLFLMLNNPNKK